MQYLQIYSRKDINSYISKRQGEIKFGECVQVINSVDNLRKELQNSSAKYILFGIPEDIGIKMNYGIGGAHTAWKATLQSLCNIQENNYNEGQNVLILGHLDFSKELKKINEKENDFKEKGNQLVRLIDTELSNLIELIVSFNKIPIIIGGGHNNSYGAIKGSSKALTKKINIVNFDAHTDFRLLEERHSGNGFSYAYHDGFLGKYFIFGIHENYTPQNIFDIIDANQDIEYTTFEELEIYDNKNFSTELEKAQNFITKTNFGIEIDLDAIESFPSSAMSPSGFSTKQARQFLHHFGKHNNATYLHICEASPEILNTNVATNQIGKFISYLISDFTKKKNGKTSEFKYDI